jgi:hypothetical protein
MVCATGLPDCRGCALLADCPYPYVFLTAPSEGQPLQHQQDVPRPFVFQPPAPAPAPVHLLPAESADFHLHLFGRGNRYLPYFIVSFKELYRHGMGQGRGRLQLAEVWAEPPPIEGLFPEEPLLVYAARDGVVRAEGLPLTWEGLLERCRPLSPECLRVRFVTPVRLKAEGRWLEPSEPLRFDLLVRAVLRRLSSLWAFHGEGLPAWPFEDILQAARKVSVQNQALTSESWHRYSGRQRQFMDLGGMRGEVVYRGPLGPFLPLLVMGSLAHVGKNATFGLGRMEVGWAVAKGRLASARGVAV